MTLASRSRFALYKRLDVGGCVVLATYVEYATVLYRDWVATQYAGTAVPAYLTAQVDLYDRYHQLRRLRACQASAHSTVLFNNCPYIGFLYVVHGDTVRAYPHRPTKPKDVPQKVTVKFLNARDLVTLPSNLVDWAHVEYYLLQPEVASIIIASIKEHP